MPKSLGSSQSILPLIVNELCHWRSWLLCIVLSWGILCLTVALSLSWLNYTENKTWLTHLAKPTVYFAFDKTGLNYHDQIAHQHFQLSLKQINALKNAFPNINAITPVITSPYPQILQYQNRRVKAPIMGKNVSSQKIEVDDILPPGRFFSVLDEQAHHHVIILSPYLSEKLFTTLNSVGKIVLLHGSPLRVIGVLNPQSNFLSGNGTNALVPLGLARDFWGTRVLGFEFLLTPHTQVAPFIAQLKNTLRHHWHLAPKETRLFLTWTLDKLYSMNQQSFFLSYCFSIACGLILFLTALSVFYNLYKYFLQQRHRQFGIILCLGADPRFISRWVFTELCGLISISTLIALLGSFVINAYLRWAGLSEQSLFAWPLIIILLIASCSVLLFGFLIHKSTLQYLRQRSIMDVIQRAF